MPLPIYRLRRLLAATAALLTLLVAGMYFYARSRARNVLSEIPGKIGYEIKQTANGFQFSKSDRGRTLFTVQASKVKEFKLDGNAELHDVSIVLYGRDSTRYDQIYGDDFSFNEKTGDVTAKGEVQIDLVANPAGLVSPDQSMPKELKNPIHLKTRDLVFNRDTGNAATPARVEFRTPQASGWAVGVEYAGKSNTLTLDSQVHVTLTGERQAVIDADHGVITSEPQENAPRQIVLDHPVLHQATSTMRSDRAVFFLSADNSVQRVVATGGVNAEAETTSARKTQTDSLSKSSQIHARSDAAEFLLTEKQNLLRTAILTGNVHLEQAGAQPMQGDAGRAVLEFAGRNELQKIHAMDGTRLRQNAAARESTATSASATSGTTGGTSGTTSGNKIGGSSPQDFELTAPVIDFTVGERNMLEKAVTSGAAQITITSAENPTPGAASTPERTVVTAGKFEGKFTSEGGRNRLSTMHGAPDARIVNSASGQPDRISTSDTVDAVFLPQGGIEAVTQQGNVVFTDNQSADKRTQAWATNARYTPSDQLLVLTGSPRIVNGSLATTANTIRINRATGDALADGDVKSTYSELKEQPNGGLLASSSPIHVTAQRMTANKTPAVALYSGKARLWQDANVIEAPSIQFDRDRRFVIAQGTAAQPVQTILVQTEKTQAQAKDGQNGPPGTTPNRATSSGGKKRDGGSSELGGSSPIVITSARLTYADSERKAHYEGGVVAKGVDFTATSQAADAYLVPRSQTSSQSSGNKSFSGPGQLDHMIATGDVLVQQPKRHADGQKLVYTAADDKFVLTGGPPSIFDAEQGKITGVSLTFFRGDDRVLVEGEASTPVVTQTRPAH